jgi:hypothetical protein
MSTPEDEQPEARRGRMTYPQAIAIRERARNKQPVDWQLVLEANQVVLETRRNAMPVREIEDGRV